MPLHPRYYRKASPPQMPTNLQVTVGSDTQLSLTWANATAGTQVEVWINGSLSTTLAVDATSYVVNGLTRCTDYTIQVRAAKGGLYSSLTAGVVGRPRVYATGGYSQQNGGYEYRWYYDGDWWFTVQAGGRINYCGFSRGGLGGNPYPDTTSFSAGGGGAAGGSYFLRYDNIEPAGNYYVQNGGWGNDGRTTYRSEAADPGGWGEDGQAARGGNGGYCPVGYGGGAGFAGGAGAANGGGGGGGAGGSGGNGGSSGGGGGAPGYIPIFGNICRGGQGGRLAGGDASEWGMGGTGQNPQGTQVSRYGFNGGSLFWFPI